MSSEASPQIPSIANEQVALPTGGTDLCSGRSVFAKVAQQEVRHAVHHAQITFDCERAPKLGAQPVRLLVPIGLVRRVPKCLHRGDLTRQTHRPRRRQRSQLVNKLIRAAKVGSAHTTQRVDLRH